MLTFQTNKIFPISSDCCNKFEGMTFDGCYFYFTSPKTCEIYKFNKCFCFVERICVCRGYKSICYDKCCKCFWATDSSYNKIYKLNDCFVEIDCIKIKCADFTTGEINGISYCCSSNKLLISFENCMASIEKNSNTEICLIQKAQPYTEITSVDCLKDCYIVGSSKKLCECLTFYSNCNEIKLQYCLPIDFCIEDTCVVFEQDCECNLFPIIYILATKCCHYSFLIKCTISFCEECVNDCCEGNYCLPYEISNSRESINCTESCTNVIQSIALIETSLSHILNAEGEKIQKVLHLSNNCCDILKVNEAVNKTITNITHLEHVLYSKLQLTKEICPELCVCDDDYGDMCNSCDTCNTCNSCDTCDTCNTCNTCDTCDTCNCFDDCDLCNNSDPFEKKCN